MTCDINCDNNMVVIHYFVVNIKLNYICQQKKNSTWSSTNSCSLTVSLVTLSANYVFTFLRCSLCMYICAVYLRPMRLKLCSVFRCVDFFLSSLSQPHSAELQEQLLSCLGSDCLSTRELWDKKVKAHWSVSAVFTRNEDMQAHFSVLICIFHLIRLLRISECQ